jgi:hypothetical protein
MSTITIDDIADLAEAREQNPDAMIFITAPGKPRYACRPGTVRPILAPLIESRTRRKTE